MRAHLQVLPSVVTRTYFAATPYSGLQGPLPRASLALEVRDWGRYLEVGCLWCLLVTVSHDAHNCTVRGRRDL